MALVTSEDPRMRRWVSQSATPGTTPKPIVTSTFAGTGQRDLTFGVGYDQAVMATYTITIASGTTFNWSKTGGSGSESASGVTITGSAQTLGNDALTVTFGHTSGYTTSDVFTVICLPTALEWLDATDGLMYVTWSNGTTVAIAPTGGVTSITGTANQVITSGATGAVTLSLPQSIATTSNVTFGTLVLGGTVNGSISLKNSSNVEKFSVDSSGNASSAAEVSAATVVANNGGRLLNGGLALKTDQILLFATNTSDTSVSGIIGSGFNDSGIARTGTNELSITDGSSGNGNLIVRGLAKVSSTSAHGTVSKLLVNNYTTVDNAANAIFSASATTAKALVLQGIASQSANIFEVQASNGTVRNAFDSGGSIIGNNSNSEFAAYAASVAGNNLLAFKVATSWTDSANGQIFRFGASGSTGNVIFTTGSTTGSSFTRFGISTNHLVISDEGAHASVTAPASTVLAEFRARSGSSNTTGIRAINSNIDIVTANGASTVYGIATELITLNTGSTTTDSSANLLPIGAIIDFVSARITTAITTAANWSVGDASSATRFINANTTLAAGTTEVAISNTAQTTAAQVRITTDVNPGAGAIRISVHYHQAVAATS